MGLKGTCLLTPYPSEETPHLSIIISEDMEGYALIVPITSMKYKIDGSEKYYDKSCIIEKDEIKNDKGSVLDRRSYLNYHFAREVKITAIFEGQFLKTFSYRCNISDNLLQRAQDGAKATKDLQPRFKKYFSAF